MITKNSLKIISGRRVLIREEKYAYLLPCERLRSLISNFTITFPDPSIISDNYTVMPHGSVTLVFFQDSGGLHSWLFGPASKPQKIGDIANKCDYIFIIEFQPAGFYPFGKMNQKELKDKIISFSSIDPSLDAVLRHSLSSSLTPDDLLEELEKQLIQNIKFPYPEELAQALLAAVQTEGVVTAAEISNDVHYSPRHLNRLFNLYLGMSRKAFSRLVKINRSFKLLNEKSNTLEYISEKLGYYDVSHFVKDFKTVCGITPQTYRANMSDFYSEVAKF